MPYAQSVVRAHDGQGALHRAKEAGQEPEKAARDMKASTDSEKRKRGEMAQAAVDAIKKDQKAAADERYTFLFSAAFMQMIGGVRRAPNVGADPKFPGNAPEDTWVSGHNHAAELKAAEAQAEVQEWNSTITRSAVKRETYLPALAILKKKAVRKPAAAGQP